MNTEKFDIAEEIVKEAQEFRKVSDYRVGRFKQ